LLERAIEAAEELAGLPRSAYPRVKEQLRGETVAALHAQIEAGDPMLGSWVGDEAAAASAAILERPSG
jgi:hypothetical protein